jgi:hypothetical protein
VLAPGGQSVAFGAATNGARNVEARRRLRAAGQDEAPQRRQSLVELVAEPLELVNGVLRNPQTLAFAKRHGEVRSDVEELVLDRLQPRTKPLRKIGRGEHEPDVRVQLVDRAVRADPGIQLRDAAEVAEGRLALVTRARVDPRQADGFVAFACAHSVETMPRT